MVKRHNANQAKDKKKNTPSYQDERNPIKLLLKTQKKKKRMSTPCRKVSHHIDYEQKKRS